MEVLNLEGIEGRWKSIGLKLNIDDGTNVGFHSPRWSLRFRCVCPRYDPSSSSSSSKTQKRKKKTVSGKYHSLDCGADTREGRTAAFCFGAGQGMATCNKDAAVLMNQLEFFAQLAALRGMRVTPQAVSIMVNDGDDEDDDGVRDFSWKKYIPDLFRKLAKLELCCKLRPPRVRCTLFP
jgi:hypothetical protein